MAAVAVVGFLVYMGLSSGKKSKTKDSSSGKQKAVAAAPVEETKRSEPATEIENHFFIDQEKTPQEANEIIKKWMNDQVEALLGQYVTGKLPVSDNKLNEEDFFRLMQIVNCR